MKRALLLSALVLPSLAVAAEGETRRIDLGGAITLDYDDAHWSVPRTTLAPGETALIVCRESRCGPGGLVSLRVAREASCPAEPETALVDGLDWERDDSPLTRRIGGLVIHGQIWHSPCRNYVPPRQQICTVHDGVVVTMGSSGVSCRSAPGVSRSEFEELVSGLAAARREGPQ